MLVLFSPDVLHTPLGGVAMNSGPEDRGPEDRGPEDPRTRGPEDQGPEDIITEGCFALQQLPTIQPISANATSPNSRLCLVHRH